MKILIEQDGKLYRIQSFCEDFVCLQEVADAVTSCPVEIKDTDNLTEPPSFCIIEKLQELGLNSYDLA
jgi:hypothetical protein